MQLRAYLISGEFRVHRADCRDCQREARRSDSPGNAEEHASRADVIASLWSDIIAEDLGLYGTPAAWPASKPRPSSCPAPAGCLAPALPETAARPTELAARAAGLGLGPSDLDDLVHDLYSMQAPETNNGGLGSQVKVPGRDLRHWARPAPAQRPPATDGKGREPGAGQSSARCRLPASSAARLARPGRPASAPGGPAVFQAFSTRSGPVTRWTWPTTSATGASAGCPAS